MPLINEGRSKPPYMTAEEAAKLLRTTRRAIYARIERGELKPAVRRFGRKILLSRVQLIALIEACAEVTTP